MPAFLYSLYPTHNYSFDPIRPGLLSLSPGRRGGGLRGPDAKNQGYHQPIEMIYYSHESMPDAKFEPDNFPSFRDMTSQNFPLKKGTSHRIRILTPGKWV